MTENDLSFKIRGVAYEIHKELGPGLLESVYEEIMYYELRQLGLKVDRQKAIPVVWKDIKMEHGFRADLIVENKVIIEIKSVETIAKVYYKILGTYVNLTGFKLGILINFNEYNINDGIKRYINGVIDK
ncbi:MAG: GxxExxY protein [Bacteroidales bacterium]|nr:GxxExxY protein [Bacteroidales bacterium]